MALDQDRHGLPIPSWGPSSRLLAITPSDDTDLSAQAIRGLWVGTGGNLSVIALNDSSAVTISNVADGTMLPIMVKKVMAATTATGIVGMA